MAENNCTNNSIFNFPSTINVYISTVEICVLSISISLNLIIFASVCFSRRLHTFSHMLLATLAASDLIYATAFEITSAGNLYMTTVKRPVAHWLVLYCACFYLISISLVCSRCCHFIISVERWLYIARPFVHYRLIKPQSMVCSLISVWVASLLSGVHVVTDCSNSVSEFMLGYATIDSTIHFVFGGLILVIYIHIGFIIRRQSLAIFTSRSAVKNNSDKAINRRMTWNMVRLPVTIFGSIFLFMTPLVIANIYLFVTIGNPEIYIGNVAYDSLKTISLFHTWANFFVYVLQDKEFRLVLKSCNEIIRNSVSDIRIHPIDN